MKASRYQRDRTSWWLQLVGIFVDVIGDEAGEIGRSQVMKRSVEWITVMSQVNIMSQ